MPKNGNWSQFFQPYLNVLVTAKITKNAIYSHHVGLFVHKALIVKDQ